MTRFVMLTGIAMVYTFICDAGVRAEEEGGAFSKLAFLEGAVWKADVKTERVSMGISDLEFKRTLNNKFLQINYTIIRDGKKKLMQIMVARTEGDSLKGWAFTSEGKTYETAIKVEAMAEGCILHTVTDKHAASIKFKRMGNDSFEIEYSMMKPHKLDPVKTKVRRSNPQRDKRE